MFHFIYIYLGLYYFIRSSLNETINEYDREGLNLDITTTYVRPHVY